MLKPTEEQETILIASDSGDLTVEALAGTGKTSTLKMLAERKKLRMKNGLYVAYNKAISEDAKASFPSNTVCSTAHSLAWKAIVKNMHSPYGYRLKNSERVPGRQLAANLGTHSFKLSDKDVALSETHIAYMMMDTVRRFCHSTSLKFEPWMVPNQEGVSDEDMNTLREMCVEKAKEIWSDIENPNGKGKFEHDHYLKLWSMTRPELPYDFIMLDEAQDADPVIADIFESQANTQKIMVGDRNQAIYGWRGALDAMQNFKGFRLYLSQSFRFGPAIAEEANKWLTLLDSPMMLKGFDPIHSVVEPVDEPDVILCRTNSGGVSNVMAYQQRDQKVALVGGGRDVENFAFAALDLMKGKRTSHPQLAAFEDWEEVLKYVDEDASGSDLKVSVKLCQNYGPVAVIAAMKALVPEKDADVIISTAHKAKGREWGKVRINADFMPRESENEEMTNEKKLPQTSEMQLNYVAVTRAKNVLDRSGLAWVDGLRREN